MILRIRKDNDPATWQTEDLGSAPAADPSPCQTLHLKPMAEHYPDVPKILANMVEVHAQTPYNTNGARRSYFHCMGCVINANEGFVITALSFMPSTMCILHVVFEDSMEIPAVKVYDHALGFTVIRYDASLVKGSISSITFSSKMPRVQDKMTIYGANIENLGPCPLEKTVTSIGPMTHDYKSKYFYHPLNVEVLHFEKDCSIGGAGVLLDDNGDLRGLWLPFFLQSIEWVGVPVSLLLPALKTLQRGALPPDCRMLDAELDTIH